MDDLTKMFDCPEIQDGWEPKIGDWTDKGVVVALSCNEDTPSKGVRAVGVDVGKYKNWAWFSKKELIYRPSIEQLIALLPWDGDYKLQWNDGAFDFMYPNGFGDYHYLCAKYPEEALLGGVMHELHGKKWDGNGWVEKLHEVTTHSKEQTDLITGG